MRSTAGLALVAFGCANSAGGIRAIPDEVLVPHTLEPENPVRVERLVQAPVPVADTLFVVDNSCSMEEEQAGLAANFDAFLVWLQASGLDFHAGVVSTDMTDVGHSGMLREVDGYRWVDASTPEPDTVFRDMVSLGIEGSGDERGRAAAYTAIELLADTDNVGFLREHGALHIVIVSDEDDSSGDTPISRDAWITYLLGERARRGELSISSIVTPITGCGGDGDPLLSGTPGAEYLDVTLRVGGVPWSICEPDWSGILDVLGFVTAGLKKEFFLAETPVDGSISVRTELDGVVSRPYVEGTEWVYDLSRNSIEFLAFEPQPFTVIVVQYEVRSGQRRVDPGGGTNPPT